LGQINQTKNLADKSNQKIVIKYRCSLAFLISLKANEKLGEINLTDFLVS